MYKIQDTRYIDKIKEFTNLYAWQKGHRLVVFIYSISKKFPEDEKFGITSQLRRASVSITSNIAEGFGRKNGKEKIYFYRIAHRSLIEVKSLVFVLKDTGMIDLKIFEELYLYISETQALLIGLIKSTKD